MEKSGARRVWLWFFLILGGIAVFVIFIVLPFRFLFATQNQTGNVALIPVSGLIMGSGGSSFGEQIASSQEIVEFIEQAEQNPEIKAIVIEINSPGGSAVASDEVAQAIKKSQKPVVALIREMGASGGYWIASSCDYIVAHRMSITGSIGVISSYLEFSGFMDKYGLGYERLVAGKYKDVGTPFRELNAEERVILQRKLDTIHSFFIEEVASNRHLPVEQVRELATGEFYLGVEALNFGLVDELGDKMTVENYLKEKQGITSISYVRYEHSQGLLELLTGIFEQFSFRMGEGMGSSLVSGETSYPQLR